MRAIESHRLIIYILFSWILGSQALLAQAVRTDALFWVAARWRVELGADIFLDADVEQRSFLPYRKHQAVRPSLGLRKRFGAHWQAGIAYRNMYAYSPQQADLAVDNTSWEQRLTLQAYYYAQNDRHRWQSRLQTEYRNFKPNPAIEGFPSVVQRLRWRNRWQYDLDDFRIAAYHEILVNWASNREYQFFDQNRLYAGLVVPVQDWQFDLGLLHWYQKNRSATLFYNRWILRLGIRYHLDLRDRT